MHRIRVNEQVTLVEDPEITGPVTARVKTGQAETPVGYLVNWTNAPDPMFQLRVFLPDELMFPPDAAVDSAGKSLQGGDVVELEDRLWVVTSIDGYNRVTFENRSGRRQKRDSRKATRTMQAKDLAANVGARSFGNTAVAVEVLHLISERGQKSAAFAPPTVARWNQVLSHYLKEAGLSYLEGKLPKTLKQGKGDRNRALTVFDSDKRVVAVLHTASLTRNFLHHAVEHEPTTFAGYKPSGVPSGIKP